MTAQKDRKKNLRLSWKKTPASKAKKTLREDLVAIGDIHGDIDGLLEILLHANLINAKARWCGGCKTLVQLGDVADRGPHVREVNDLLDALQKEARLSNGRVIRLVGNHELELLKGETYLTNFLTADAALYRKKLVEDVLASKIFAAYFAQGYLFTHAGLTGHMQKILLAEMKAERPDEKSFAEYINKVFARSVSKNDYTHPIFNIGTSRGGRHRYGGIFWEDVRELFMCEQSQNIKQVVAHTPLARITKNETGRLVAIDVGIFSGYGGGREYLLIRNGVCEPVSIK